MLTTIQLIALVVFIATYILIIDERIHRAVAAMAGAAVVVFLGIVPWDSMLEHIDFGTIFLLMGMMIIINVARQSGLFEYIAIRTAKLAKGSPIMVLILFSIVTAIVSAFLDNVTTVLLLTPMLLYITKLMDLNPVPFLLAEIISSNVGGAGTLIGDPPNIMIASSAGLSFNEFITIMGPIAAVDMVLVLIIFLAVYGRSMKVTKEEKGIITKTINSLDEQGAITDRKLFKKAVTVILLVVVLFFIHSSIGVYLNVIFPFVDPTLALEPAEVALIGAAIILIWSRVQPDEIFEKIEWTALFFFAGLFVIVGALVNTGIIEMVSQYMISMVSNQFEAMFVIAWFSAFASAVVDNIPLTAALIPLIHDMSATMDVYPLWWALSLGACMGGNGTAIAASANVVVLGVAAREGVNISFMQFLKIGMLTLVVTVSVGLAMLYAMFGML
ncbi:ArsB/NhaD family transporter [Methanogenium marinum]|uniref:ArsB/NhaD family transporter n=1 Tax=Methanogenium marinum TaxID=348610 RepID=A0A9Q4KUX4_9EURY|nr:ArsB/NhaD family transporter [Methanogenium marinum]MDE4907800.1 ArsB/NhaD family transporter [Methanogenium marinum]